MRVVVTGGTGFVGASLCERLVARGHDVVALTRDASRARDHVHPRVRVASWAEGAAWEGFLDGAGALVHLAGETIAQRWTARAKERIAASRIESARRLEAAARKAGKAPAVLVSASAVGYYGPHGDEILDETAPPGEGFLARLCVDWEAAAAAFEHLGVRVVRLRAGLVLAPGGGALAKMLPPFKAFVGGPAGTGKQWTSWIHRDDLVDLYVFAVENAAASGPMNATAPEPVTARAFAAALGRALHRPSFVPAPAPVLRLAFGEMASVVLTGQRVVPQKALDLGFAFRHPEVGAALRDVVGD